MFPVPSRQEPLRQPRERCRRRPTATLLLERGTPEGDQCFLAGAIHLSQIPSNFQPDASPVGTGRGRATASGASPAAGDTLLQDPDFPRLFRGGPRPMTPGAGAGLAARIGRSFGWLLLGRAVTVLATLGFLALVTRYLGPAGYGEFRTAQAYLGFVYLLANLGLPALLLREMGTAGAARPEVLAAALGLRLASAVLVFLFAVAAAPLLPWDPVVHAAVLAGAFGFVALSLFDTLIAVFRERLQQVGQLRAELASAGSLLVGAALTVAFGGGVAALAAVLGAAHAVQLAVAWVEAGRFLRVRFAFDGDRWRRLLVAALPLALANVLTLVYYRADTIVLSLLRPAAEVGIYGVASRLQDTAVGVAILFVGLLTPLLAARRADADAFRHLLGHGIDAVAVGGGAVLLVLAVFGGDLAVLIGGAGYAAAAVPAAVLGLTFWLASFSLLLRDATVGLDRQRELLPGYVAAVVAASAAYLLLVPAAGPVGAALGTLVGEACVLARTAGVLARVGRLPDRRRQLATVVAALLVAALAGLALRPVLPWPVALATAGCLYLAVLAMRGLVGRGLLAALGLDPGRERSPGPG